PATPTVCRPPGAPDTRCAPCVAPARPSQVTPSACVARAATASLPSRGMSGTWRPAATPDDQSTRTSALLSQAAGSHVVPGVLGRAALPGGGAAAEAWGAAAGGCGADAGAGAGAGAGAA